MKRLEYETCHVLIDGECIGEFDGKFELEALDPVEEPLTAADVQRAADQLGAMNVPAFEGYYYAHLDPWSALWFELYMFPRGRGTYRQELLLRELFDHEQRRALLGRRSGPPTIDELRARVLRSS